MHNLETPRLKLGVFQPLDSFGQALIAAALHRLPRGHVDVHARPTRSAADGPRHGVGSLIRFQVSDDLKAVSRVHAVAFSFLTSGAFSAKP